MKLLKKSMKESSNVAVARIFGIIFLVILGCLLIIKVLRQGIYSHRMGVNIAIVGDTRVGLLMLRPDEEVVGWVSFPSNLMIKIFNSDARYPVASLWDYGILEKNPYEIIEKSIGLSMGVGIARTIKIKGNPSVEEILANLHKIDLKTDLSVRDRFLIRKFLSDTVASKKVLEMDIPKKIFDTTVDPDGKEFVVFNSVASLWTKNKFVLDAILSENVDLVVNNLSGQPGLGTQIARQLESAGMRVIEVKSDPSSDTTGKGCLFSIAGSYPFTESLLVEQMNCTKAINFAASDQEKGITIWVK